MKKVGHTREGGYPIVFEDVDSRLHGNDGQIHKCHFQQPDKTAPLLSPLLDDHVIDCCTPGPAYSHGALDYRHAGNSRVCRIVAAIQG